jgi:molecular chaperone GrpE
MREDDFGNAGDGGPVEETVDESAAGAEDSTLSVDASDGGRARLEAAVAAERDKHLRLAAEFDNFRKRSIRERQEAGSKAQADLVQGLVEVLDDIMRFAHLDPATVDSNTVVQGVAMVERKVMKTLAGHGLELVDPVGRPFDPAFHEAVGTEPASSPEEDHLVARVYQSGYLFRGQLLRPARVVVKQWPG